MYGLNTGGQLLLRLVNERQFVRAQGRGDVAAPPGVVPELDLLRRLGWCLLLAQAKERAATMTAIKRT